MSKLITPSIWNAVQWAKDAPTDWQTSAREQLTNQLSRVPMGPDVPKAITRGLDFERMVEVCTRRDKDTWEGSPLFNKVVDECRGGKWQQVAKKTIKVDDEEHLLYGRIDVMFPDKIIDLKTTSTYRDPGYFLKGIQHKIYALATKITKFTYKVILMTESDKILDVYDIDWEAPPLDELEEDIIRQVHVFRMDLRRWGLEEMYLTKFCR
jgi:hypothetical protein